MTQLVFTHASQCTQDSLYIPIGPVVLYYPVLSFEIRRESYRTAAIAGITRTYRLGLYERLRMDTL